MKNNNVISREIKKEKMKQNRKSIERILISFGYALKKILGKKANHGILEGFLSELLEQEITLQRIKCEEKDLNRVDILGKDKDGENVLIELIYTSEIYYHHRLMYEISPAISDRLFDKDERVYVDRTYSINIVYCKKRPGRKYVYCGGLAFKDRITNKEIHLSKADRKAFQVLIADVNLTEYIIILNSFDNTINNGLDEWIYFFKNNAVKDDFTAKGLDKAKEVLSYDKLTPKEQKDYDNWLRDHREKII
jgi:hypothetical protein